MSSFYQDQEPEGDPLEPFAVIGDDALIGPVRKLVHLYCPPLDANLLVVVFYVWLGVQLGRGVFTRVSGRDVYPNLYVVALGADRLLQATLHAVERVFEPFPPHPRILASGVTSTEAMIFPIRDNLFRHDKVYTEQGGDPEWRLTKVDEGSSERRLILADASLLTRLQGNSQRAVSLRATLLHGFHGYDLASYMRYRDGGFLKSTAPHVTVLTTHPSYEEDWGRTLPGFLFVRPLSGASDVFGDLPVVSADALIELQAMIYATLTEPPGMLPLEPAAVKILEGLMNELPPRARVLVPEKFGKLGTIAGRLLWSRSVGEVEAAAAAAILRHAAFQTESLAMIYRERQIAAVAAKIKELLSQHPDGLSLTTLSESLGRDVRAELRDAALDMLCNAGLVSRSVVPTGGCPTKRYTLL